MQGVILLTALNSLPFSSFFSILSYLISCYCLTGAYVPLTMEGNIIVDDVLVSFYASVDHDLAHLIMTPMQRFPEIMEWIFGDDAGFPVFVNTLKELGLFLLSDGHFWHN